MRGKSHIAMNVVTAGTVACTGFLFIKSDLSESLGEISKAVYEFLFDNGTISMFIFVPAAILLYLLGSLLPDIDHPYSTIGKIIHLPIPHRTWTHAIYVPVILFIAGMWYRLLFWLGLGYFFHLFWDSFSASGVNWLYPKKNKHHVLKLYHTSQPSEYMTVGVSTTLLVIYACIVLQSVYHFVNITW